MPHNFKCLSDYNNAVAARRQVNSACAVTFRGRAQLPVAHLFVHARDRRRAPRRFTATFGRRRSLPVARLTFALTHVSRTLCAPSFSPSPHYAGPYSAAAIGTNDADIVPSFNAISPLGADLLSLGPSEHNANAAPVRENRQILAISSASGNPRGLRGSCSLGMIEIGTYES
jgi:hypothetical protein